MEYFENRDRAESFGEVASDYDAYRPKYPVALISAIMDAAEAGAKSRTTTTTDGGSRAGSSQISADQPSQGVPRILDVGSGTGILAAQLKAAGAEILAVEPDDDMASVARSKGLDVEVSAFEGWNARGRTFDLVSFGQSFHWVDPMIALPRIRRLLEPGASLALAWNDIEPTGDLRTRLESISARFHPEGTAASVGTAANHDSAGDGDNLETVEHPALTQLRGAGFEPCTSTYTEERRYSKHDWLSMVFTYSAQLTMDPVKRAVMREEMAAEIPDEGLDARNEALLVLARP